MKIGALLAPLPPGLVHEASPCDGVEPGEHGWVALSCVWEPRRSGREDVLRQLLRAVRIANPPAQTAKAALVSSVHTFLLVQRLRK